MRRTKMAALGMVMVLSMAACVGRAETTAEGATMKSMEMDSGESEENMIGMPNPYTDHDTLKEAEEDALTGLVEQVQLILQDGRGLL